MTEQQKQEVDHKYAEQMVYVKIEKSQDGVRYEKGALGIVMVNGNQVMEHHIKDIDGYIYQLKQLKKKWNLG